MPVLNIKDPEAHRLASEIAQKTGKSLTRVVVDALRIERALTEPRPVDRVWLKNLQGRVAAIPKVEHGTPEEIIGYDENGLPSDR